MWNLVGIRRDGEGMREAAAWLSRFQAERGPHPAERGAIEARNLLVLGEIVTRAALEREESRGAHHRRDFPVRRDEWARHLEYRAPGPAPDLPRSR